MSEIRVFKMMAGEEVICDVVDRTEEHIIVDKPFAFQVVNAQGGALQLAMAPWILSDPEPKGIKINKNAIVLEMEPFGETEKQYIQQTTSIALI